MYKDYFKRRLLQALKRADKAVDETERAVHLRAIHYYCALLGMHSLDTHDPDALAAKTDRR